MPKKKIATALTLIILFVSAISIFALPTVSAAPAPVVADYNVATGGYSTEASVEVPADVDAGDLLIVICTTDSTGSNLGIPTGFEELMPEAMTGSQTTAAWFKVADGTEGGTTLSSTWSGGEDWVMGVVRITGAVELHEVNYAGYAYTDPPLPEFTTYVDNCLVLRFYGQDDDDDTSPIAGLPAGHTALWGETTPSSSGECTQCACYIVAPTPDLYDAAVWDQTATSEAGIAVSVVIAPATLPPHDPDWRVPTWSYVVASPNPVGVNQTVTFNFWNTVAPPVAKPDNDVRWTFSLSVTRPNGTIIDLGTVGSDHLGAGSSDFVPDEAGNWSVTISFPDTVYTWDDTFVMRVWTGDTFLNSSFTKEFTVQQEPVQDRAQWRGLDWFEISGLHGGSSSAQTWGNHGVIYRDQTVGSLTSHVLWTVPIEDGGLVGGTKAGVEGNTFYQGLAYSARWVASSAFILDGKFYYREPLGQSGTSGGYFVRDIRTGELILYRDDITSLGMGYDHNGMRFFSSTSFSDPLDPKTLNDLGWTLENVPSGTAVAAPGGEHLRIDIVDIGDEDPEWTIQQWNSSRVIVPGISGTVDADVSTAYDFRNVPITYNGQPFELPDRSIFAIKPEDYILTRSFGSSGDVLDYEDFTLWTISLKPETRGAIVANHTFYTADEPFSLIEEDLLRTPNVIDLDSHVLPLWSKRTLQWIGVDYETGNVWGPTEPEHPMNYYASPDATSYNRDAVCMNGKIIDASWGGILYCYNGKNGTLEYTYGLAGTQPNQNITSSEFMTVYGIYPYAPGPATTANGRIYLYVNEHSPSTPHLKGSYNRCFDILNVNEDWCLSSFGGVFTTNAGQMIAANGVTIWLNNHDEQTYCVGRGPSATSVSVPAQSLVEGSKMVIEGTVLDVAAGTMQHEPAARFPNGVACVSSDSMTSWMEYVYMHRPRPDVVGVDVTVSAVDANGVEYDIGTVTSDSTGYYSVVWTPDVAGTYTLTATFDGTKDYYPSLGEAVFTVAEAPEATPTPEPTPVPMTDTFILGSTIGIIAAIAIITAIIALLLRRR